MLTIDERHERDKQFYNGQLVKIRDWEDMVTDFSYDGRTNIDIPCRATFTTQMKNLCGEEGYLKLLDKNGTIEILDLKGRRIVTGWNISLDMVEPVIKNNVYNDLMID